MLFFASIYGNVKKLRKINVKVLNATIYTILVEKKVFKQVFVQLE